MLKVIKSCLAKNNESTCRYLVVLVHCCHSVITIMIRNWSVIKVVTWSGSRSITRIGSRSWSSWSPMSLSSFWMRLRKQNVKDGPGFLKNKPKNIHLNSRRIYDVSKLMQTIYKTKLKSAALKSG